MSAVPYNAQYLRCARNDYLRWGIWCALQHGAFEFDALLELLNAWLEDNEHARRHFISANGLRTMLDRNCEEAWRYESGAVFPVDGYAGSLSQWSEKRGLDCVRLILDEMIRRNEVLRERGSGILSKPEPAR